MKPVFRLLLTAVFGLFALTGAVLVASSEDAVSSLDLIAGGELVTGDDGDRIKGTLSEHGAKVALGNNANAVLSIDLITDGGVGNGRDDGVTTGTVSGRGTTIAIEVFATGVRTSLRGVSLKFDFDPSLLTYVKAENSAFALSVPEGSVGVNLAATSPVTLASSGFLARAEFETVADVSGREFAIGIESATLAESSVSSDVLRTSRETSFNSAPSPDFDGDGTVGFSDFLAFAGSFGSSPGDARYEARFDLDADGSVAFSDFLIFAGAFGSQVPPPGGAGTPSDTGETVTIADANLRAVISDSLGKAGNAPITRAEMATLTGFDASNKGIRNLTGLEHAVNLGWLELDQAEVNGKWVNSNDISDLSPLSNLTNLTVLYLGDNNISDISALSNLTNMTHLSLYRNHISDISSLSNLTNLKTMGLDGNNISDISSLSNLTNLESLGLDGNNISDISALSNLVNLERLSLWSNSISNISSLSNLTNSKYLYLGRNSITDISALSSLTNLLYLYLWHNSISDISPLVANAGLGDGDIVNLKDNPLSSTSRNTHIPILQRRGVKVEVDGGTATPPSGNPDLIVESPSVDDNTLTTGQSFTLSATVRNQGNASAAATTLRYYRSSNTTISTDDVEVGTDAVNSLSAGGTSAESISLNAPSDAGTYYYGACVDGVTGESNTDNNCSSGLNVTVSAGGGVTSNLGACRVGLVVRPNESCTVSGGSFRNIGGGCYNYTPFGSGRLCSARFNLNGLQGTRAGDDFRITAVP